LSIDFINIIVIKYMMLEKVLELLGVVEVIIIETKELLPSEADDRILLSETALILFLQSWPGTLLRWLCYG
jgi:hypothetical protein